MTTIQPFAEQGNFTQMHNFAFDHVMPNVSGSAWKIFSLIIRKTKGWQKDEDDISYSQLRKGTGISSNTTIKKGIAELLELGVIQQGKPAHEADPYGYRLNKNYSCRVTENDTPSTKKWTTGVSETVNTKETTTKERKKEKENTPPIEELVNLFAEETNLRIPKNGKIKDDWIDPIVAINKASGEHFNTTKERMLVAISILRENGYTIANPGSIQNTAVNLDIHPPTPKRNIPKMVFIPETNSYKPVGAHE